MVDQSCPRHVVPLRNACTVPRRRFLALGASASAAAVLTACAPSPPASAPEKAGAAAPTAFAKPTPPAKLLATSIKIGLPTIATTLDPHGTLGGAQFQVARPVYDALFIFGQNEQIVGQLATAWKRIDPLTTELKLRDDVRFSNGEAFTAETVKANLERVMGSKEADHVDLKARLGAINAAEVVNSSTVRIRTREPEPLLLNRLTLLFMLPLELTKDTQTAKTKTIGTGPFKLTRFETNKQVTFEAWDGSWQGKPKIQTATFQAIPEPATLMSALRTGEVDLIHYPPADQVRNLVNEGFKVAETFEGAATVASFVPNHPLMRDKRVREALNYAVNKEELLQTVQAGYGQVCTGQLIPPGMLGYQPDVKAIPYDPERARSLLRQAGAIDQELSIVTLADSRAIFEAVVGYLNAVGVKARLDVVDRAIYLKNLTDRTSYPMIGWNVNFFHIRDFDAAGFRFSTLVPQPHFENQEFYRLYDAARTELDQNKRADQIGRMIRIMRDEFAALFLVWRTVPNVLTKKITKLDLWYDRSFGLATIEKEA